MTFETNVTGTSPGYPSTGIEIDFIVSALKVNGLCSENDRDHVTALSASAARWWRGKAWHLIAVKVFVLCLRSNRGQLVSQSAWRDIRNEMETYPFPQFAAPPSLGGPSRVAHVHIALFKNVSNAAWLRSRLVEVSTIEGAEGDAAREEMDYALIEGAMVRNTIV